MAITQVRIQINGTWTTLTKQGGAWVGTVTAPGTTSFNLAGGYYPATVQATNSAGTTTTVSASEMASLRLAVKERVKPTISITSPGAGAHVINSRQPVVFVLRDEVGGSGVKLSTLALKIDGGATINSASHGMVCTPSGNGYDCVYTPPSALSDGAHTVTINVSDNDGNTATQASRTYKIDTQPPTLNVTSPADGFVTNTAAVTLQGKTNDAVSSSVTVAITLNGASVGGATPDAGGNFTKALTLAEGANTIVVTSTDAAGQQSTVTINGVLDTTVPVITSATIAPNPADAGATLTVSVVIA